MHKIIVIFAKLHEKIYFCKKSEKQIDNMKTILILIAVISVQSVYAQHIRFKEVKNHMIAEVSLNKQVKARALIDTGSSITVLDSTFVVSSGLKLNPTACHHALRLTAIGKTLWCYQVISDTLDVDGLRNTRPVYIADLRQAKKWFKDGGYDMIMGSCYMAKDGSQMVTLNIAKGYVKYGKQALPENKYKRGIMTIDKKGFVGTDAPLRIMDSDYRSGQIIGRFIIDTGNANFFFLCGKSEGVIESLNRQGFELSERTKDGKTIKYIKMDSAEMLGKKVNMEKSILPIIPASIGRNYAGAIGYKFLKEVELVLDYDNNFLYIKQ